MASLSADRRFTGQNAALFMKVRNAKRRIVASGMTRMAAKGRVRRLQSQQICLADGLR
jgi:hypothetical protein